MINNLGFMAFNLNQPYILRRKVIRMPNFIVPARAAVSEIGNDTFNITESIGPPGPPGPPGNPSPVKVTQVTTPSYTALSTDYFLCVTHAGPVVITLPTGVLGVVYIIKDCDGNASFANPIIVQGTLQNVDIGTATINTSFGSLSVIFNGTAWSVV